MNANQTPPSILNPFEQWDIASANRRKETRIKNDEDKQDETLDEGNGNQDALTAAPQENTEVDLDTKETNETTPAASEETVTSKNEGSTPKKEEPKSTNPDDTWEKRYADLRRLDQDRLNTINSLKKEIEDLKKKPDLSRIKTDEELAKFEAESPELYALIEAVALKKSNDLKKKVDELEEQQRALDIEKAMKELLKKHPDAEEIKVDPKYKDWFDKQSIRVQDLIQYGTIDDVSYCLDKYKHDLNIVTKSRTEAKKEEQARAAAAIGSSSKATVKDSPKQWRESEIHKMPDKVYAKLKPEIDIARREGRIIFDM